jgi:hypothetical protein
MSGILHGIFLEYIERAIYTLMASLHLDLEYSLAWKDGKKDRSISCADNNCT